MMSLFCFFICFFLNDVDISNFQYKKEYKFKLCRTVSGIRSNWTLKKWDCMVVIKRLIFYKVQRVLPWSWGTALGHRHPGFVTEPSSICAPVSAAYAKYSLSWGFKICLWVACVIVVLYAISCRIALCYHKTWPWPATNSTVPESVAAPLILLVGPDANVWTGQSRVFSALQWERGKS